MLWYPINPAPKHLRPEWRNGKLSMTCFFWGWGLFLRDHTPEKKHQFINTQGGGHPHQARDHKRVGATRHTHWTKDSKPPGSKHGARAEARNPEGSESHCPCFRVQGRDFLTARHCQQMVNSPLAGFQRGGEVGGGCATFRTLHLSTDTCIRTHRIFNLAAES